MPYVPRPATTIKCAHCKTAFESRHASRKYCSNSCNVLASYERTGYRGEPRASRADLERTLAKMMELMNIKPELDTSKPATPKPTAKAAATKQKPEPVAKTAPIPPKPAAKAAAKVPAKKPAAKAAVKPNPKTAKPATKPAKKVVQPTAKAVTAPKPASPNNGIYEELTRWD